MSAWTPAEIEAFLKSVGISNSVADYPRSTVIFSQDEAADQVFFLQRGRISLSVISAEGREAVVDVVRAGEFFGIGALTMRARRLVTAKTMTSCRTFFIPKADMARLLRDRHELADVFLAQVLARNLMLEETLIEQMFSSAEQRLARVLLRLGHDGDHRGSHHVAPKVSQAALAEMVGTTRQRVNFFMNKFRRLGLIEYNGELKIHSSLAKMLRRDGSDASGPTKH